MANLEPDSSSVHLTQLIGVFDPVEAELVRNTLIDHDIDCALEGEHQAGFTGTIEIGILVREADLAKAREVLKVHHPHLI